MMKDGSDMKCQYHAERLKAAFITLLLACAVLAACTDARKPDTESRTSAVKGTVTKILSNDWPEVIHILGAKRGDEKKAMACMGVQIGPRTFLTAAHCVVDDSFPMVRWRLIRPRTKTKKPVRLEETTIKHTYPDLGFPIERSDVDLAVLCTT